MTARAESWTRTRLLALLAGVIVVGVALAVGLAWSLRQTIDGHDSDDQREEARTPVEPWSDMSLSRPGPLTTTAFDRIVLPTPTALGPASVSTGFPRTSEGALAQLAAIDQVALQSASVTGAQVVISGWAVPGGPTPETWSGVRAMAEFLTSAGLPAGGSSELVVAADPHLGLVSGDPNATVEACVVLVVTATFTTTARVAAADCQNMVWQRGRWMIGPGLEPEQPTAIWPGTQAALDAGWQELVP